MVYAMNPKQNISIHVMLGVKTKQKIDLVLENQLLINLQNKCW